MPQVTANGTELHYDDTASGSETIVMAHGLLLNGRMFDGVITELRNRYRCITFDFRGQGQSAISPNRYDLNTLTEDAAGLIRELGCGPCHFLGFSMGGFVGMRLAVQHPELVRSLILVGTSASREPQRLKFRLLGRAARCLGVRAVTPLVMPVQVGRSFLRDPARAGLRQEWFDRIAANDLTGGLMGVNAVVARTDFSGQLGHIRVPTLVVVGAEDRPTPPAEAKKLLAGIAGAELVIVPRAGHAVPIEEPAVTAEAIAHFLTAHPARL